VTASEDEAHRPRESFRAEHPILANGRIAVGGLAAIHVNREAVDKERMAGEEVTTASPAMALKPRRARGRPPRLRRERPRRQECQCQSRRAHGARRCGENPSSWKCSPRAPSTTKLVAAAGWLAVSGRGFLSTAAKKQGLTIQSMRYKDPASPSQDQLCTRERCLCSACLHYRNSTAIARTASSRSRVIRVVSASASWYTINLIRGEANKPRTPFSNVSIAASFSACSPPSSLSSAW